MTEGGIFQWRAVPVESQAIGEVAMEVERIHGDDEMAQGEAWVLGERRDQRPWTGGSSAFHQNQGRRWIKHGNSGERPAHGFLKKPTGMWAVQSGGASGKRAHARCRALLRQQFGIQAEFAQIVHDDSGIPQFFILPPTPQQRGFSRSEESGEEGDGECVVSLQQMRVF
jgi:hypothetical protein